MAFSFSSCTSNLVSVVMLGSFSPLLNPHALPSLLVIYLVPYSIWSPDEPPGYYSAWEYLSNLRSTFFICEWFSAIFVVSLLPPVLSFFFYLSALVMSNSNTPFFLDWVVYTCMRDLYIYYSSSIPASLRFNFFSQFLTSSNTSWKITSGSAMSTGLTSSSCNMDTLLVCLFFKDTISSTFRF